MFFIRIASFSEEDRPLRRSLWIKERMARVFFVLLAIKMLLAFAAVLFVCTRMRRRGTERAKQCPAVAVLLTAALLAHCAGESLPCYYDPVTITATGQTGADAQSNEIFVSGFTVDGRDCRIERILEGKWFWTGTDYCWRKSDDGRKPGTLTDSVTLGVPVGRLRTLNFSANEWRGIAEVSCLGQSFTADTSQNVSVELPGSDLRGLMRDAVPRLAVYLFLLAAACVVVTVFSKKENEAWLNKHSWTLVYLAIALGQFIFALSFAGKDSLWYDELYELGLNSSGMSVWERLLKSNAPLPLWTLGSKLWYKLAPYGEKWLLLPFEMSAAGGVFFTGLCGREARNERTGMLAAITAAVSETILVQCSYEARSYAFFYFFSAILLFLMLRRRTHSGHETKRELIRIAIVMFLFTQMHYHALVQCAALFVIDVFLCWKGKLRRQCLLPYLAAAVTTLPVLLYMVLAGKASAISESWQSLPSPDAVLKLLRYLSGNSVLTELLLLTALASFLVLIRQKADDNPYKGQPAECFLLLLPTLRVLLMVLYGLIVNRETTLWSERYFIDLCPSVAVLAGIGADRLCTALPWCRGKVGERTAALVLLLALIVLSWPGLTDTAKKVREPYRQVADWLYKQSNNIYNHSTLILATDEEPVVLGWKVYYLEQQGRRDPIRAIGQEQLTVQELEGVKRIYLVHIHALEGLLPEVRQMLTRSFAIDSTEQDGKVQIWLPKGS